MTIFSTEALYDNGSTLSVVSLTVVDDDDVSIVSSEIGTEYSIDGVSQGADAPVLENGLLEFVKTDGTTLIKFVIYFVDSDGNDVYFFPDSIDPNTIASITSYNQVGTPNGIRNYTRSLIDEDANTYFGQALLIQDSDPTDGFDPDLTALSIADVTIWDDDGKFEFSGNGDGAASEAKNETQAKGKSEMVLYADEYNSSTTIFGANGTGASNALSNAANLALVTIGYDIDGDGIEDGTFTAVILNTTFGPSASPCLNCTVWPFLGCGHPFLLIPFV